jgi:hypothetical protein
MYVYVVVCVAVINNIYVVASARVDEGHASTSSPSLHCTNSNGAATTAADDIEEGVITYGIPMDNNDNSNKKEGTDIAQSIMVTTSTQVDRSVVLLPVFYLPTDNTMGPQLVIMKVAQRGSTLSPRDLKAAIMPHIPVSELEEGLLTWSGVIDLGIKDLNVYKVVVENGQTTTVTLLKDSENLLACPSTWSSYYSLLGGASSSTVVYCVEAYTSKCIHVRESIRWRDDKLSCTALVMCVFYFSCTGYTITNSTLLLCTMLFFPRTMTHQVGLAFEYLVGDYSILNMLVLSRADRIELEPNVALEIKNYYLRHSAHFS